MNEGLFFLVLLTISGDFTELGEFDEDFDFNSNPFFAHNKETTKTDWKPKEGSKSRRNYERIINGHKRICNMMKIPFNRGASIVNTCKTLIQNEVQILALIRTAQQKGSILSDEDKNFLVLWAEKVKKYSTLCSYFSVLRGLLKHEHLIFFKKDLTEITNYETYIQSKSKNEKKKQSDIFTDEQEKKILRLKKGGNIRNCKVAYVLGESGGLRPQENYYIQSEDVKYFKQIKNPIGCGWECNIEGTRVKCDELNKKMTFWVIPDQDIELDKCLEIIMFDVLKPDRIRNTVKKFQPTLKVNKRNNYETFSKSNFGINNYYNLGKVLGKEIGVSCPENYLGYCARRKSDKNSVVGGCTELEMMIGHNWTPGNNVQQKAKLYFQKDKNYMRSLGYKRKYGGFKYMKILENTEISGNSFSIYDVAFDLVSRGIKIGMCKDVEMYVKTKISIAKLQNLTTQPVTQPLRNLPNFVPTQMIGILPQPTQPIRILPQPTQNVRISPQPTQNVRISPQPTQNVRISPQPTQNVRISLQPTQNVRISPQPTQNVRISPQPTQNVRISLQPTQNVRILQNQAVNDFSNVFKNQPVRKPPLLSPVLTRGIKKRRKLGNNGEKVREIENEDARVRKTSLKINLNVPLKKSKRKKEKPRRKKKKKRKKRKKKKKKTSEQEDETYVMPLSDCYICDEPCNFHDQAYCTGGWSPFCIKGNGPFHKKCGYLRNQCWLCPYCFKNTQ